MNLEELKEKYDEFNEVINKLQEIEREITKVDTFNTVCVYGNGVHGTSIGFTNGEDAGKIKAIVLDILNERRVAVLMDGECLMQRILESLKEIK